MRFCLDSSANISGVGYASEMLSRRWLFFSFSSHRFWRSFGISPKGQMTGSDVIMVRNIQQHNARFRGCFLLFLTNTQQAGVDGSSKAVFDDRFVVQRSLPPKDVDLGSTSDWTMVSVSVVNGWTWVEGDRPLMSADTKNDVPIPPGPVTVVVSYGSSSISAPQQHDVYKIDTIEFYLPTLQSFCGSSSKFNDRASVIDFDVVDYRRIILTLSLFFFHL